MRSPLLGLFAATVLTGATCAAEPATAQDHATQYQREVRAALRARGWHITQDEAGKLTAERRKTSQDGTREFLVGDNLDPEVRLEISFRPDGAQGTAASARASLCYYNQASPGNVHQLFYPPLVFRNPKLTQEYREVLAEANAHLANDHRADAAGSGKVAMK